MSEQIQIPTDTSPFNPREHLMMLGYGKDAKEYLEVKWRIVWFRKMFPQGTIQTQEKEIDLDRVIEKDVWEWNQQNRRKEKVHKVASGYARFHAVVTDGQGGVASSTGSECAVDFDDFVEKAETKAIGRALAALGFGTQFAPELEEGMRIVDSPVERQEGAQTAPTPPSSPATPAPSKGAASAPIAVEKKPDLHVVPKTVMKTEERDAIYTMVNEHFDKRFQTCRAERDAFLTDVGMPTDYLQWTPTHQGLVTSARLAIWDKEPSLEIQQKAINVKAAERKVRDETKAWIQQQFQKEHTQQLTRAQARQTLIALQEDRITQAA